MSQARLKPRYFTESEFADYIKKHSTADTLIHEIVTVRDTGGDMENISMELFERHKQSSKELFYPFVHALFNAMGLKCTGEVGRIDGLIRFNSRNIPCEIKSFTETPTYNMKGARQAVDNWICTYRDEYDLDYASLLVGYEQPSSTIEIESFIEAVFKTWGIKILALDLRSLVNMCVRSIWEERMIDFDELLKQHGIIEEL